MNIRDATARDAPAIVAIWNKEIRDGTATFTSIDKTVPAVADLIENAEAFWVAERSGEAVAFCTISPFRNGPGYAGCRELTIYVDKTARGAGVGLALVEALETRAKSLGVHSLIGGISGANAPALAFHKALGFQEVGRLPQVGEKFGHRLDLIFMLKKL